MANLQVVSLDNVRPNPVALRQVDRNSEAYLGLVESIRNKGFIGAISVREAIDKVTEETYFELIDGLHRFSAAGDAGLNEIKVDIVDFDDDQVLETQILANIHKIDTKPMQYTEQLKRILSRNPLMTINELAGKLGKSSQWIEQRLSLQKIENQRIKELVDEGKITLTNAYALAKLPADEQVDFLDRAQTMPPSEFLPAVNERAKEIRDARRKGSDAGAAEFTPVAHLRRMKDLKAILEDTGPVAEIVADCTNPAEGFVRGIEFVLHLDPESIRLQKEKDEERKALVAQKKEARARERAAKKAEKAAQAAEEAAAATEQLA